MTSFENIEIAVVNTPTTKEVLDHIRRDEPCQADPSSPHCTLASARDDYLLGDAEAGKICRSCPTFERMGQKLLADWAEGSWPCKKRTRNRLWARMVKKL